MEPTNKSSSNSVSQEVFDHHLEKIVRDFHEFQGRMPDAIKLEDLIDMYINTGANLPGDMNESESPLVPALQTTHGFNTGTSIQESDNVMINETAEDTSQNDTLNFPDSSPRVSTIPQERGEESNSRVNHIRYGDLNFPGVADGIIGGVFDCSAETVFRSVMKSFRTPGVDVKNLQQPRGEKENWDGATSRNSIKRKYKQIMETEYETSC